MVDDSYYLDTDENDGYDDYSQRYYTLKKMNNYKIKDYSWFSQITRDINTIGWSTNKNFPIVIDENDNLCYFFDIDLKTKIVMNSSEKFLSVVAGNIYRVLTLIESKDYSNIGTKVTSVIYKSNNFSLSAGFQSSFGSSDIQEMNNYNQIFAIDPIGNHYYGGIEERTDLQYGKLGFFNLGDDLNGSLSNNHLGNEKTEYDNQQILNHGLMYLPSTQSIRYLENYYQIGVLSLVRKTQSWKILFIYEPIDYSIDVNTTSSQPYVTSWKLNNKLAYKEIIPDNILASDLTKKCPFKSIHFLKPILYRYKISNYGNSIDIEILNLEDLKYFVYELEDDLDYDPSDIISRTWFKNGEVNLNS